MLLSFSVLYTSTMANQCGAPVVSRKFVTQKRLTQYKKNAYNLAYDAFFFHKTCTIGLYTYSANDPYQKQRIDKISRTVPLLIAGHIL